MTSVATTLSIRRLRRRPRLAREELGLAGHVVRLGVLFVMSVYFLVPLVWLLTAPSKDTMQLYDDSNPFLFGTLERLATSWQDIITYQNGALSLWVGNSVRYALLAMAGALAICVPAGFVLAIVRFPGRMAVLWLTLITMLIPPSALVLPTFLELNLAHLINTQWAVILPAWFFPFGVYLTFIYFRSTLPTDVVDAARVDGASLGQLLRHIGLPMARPLLALLAFINFNVNWNNFFGPYVMLSDDKLFNLPVGIATVVSSTAALRPGFNPTPGAIAFQQADAALAGLVMVVPVAIVFIFAQRYIVAGASAGSVKG